MNDRCPDCELLWQERAAIMEYEGGMTRTDAEAHADAEIICIHWEKDANDEH